MGERILFHEQVKKVLTNANGCSKVIVVYIDIIELKAIRDILGSKRGDQFVEQIKRALEDCLGNGQTVRQMGESEFAAVLLTKCEHEAIQIAEIILNKFKKIWVVDHMEICLSLNIGIASYPDNGIDPYALINSADMAMYCAKQQGKNSYQIYNKQKVALQHEKLKMNGSLRRAVEQNEFIVYYQPQIALNSGRIVGIEALVRWMSPTKGMIPPGEFIMFAEENEIITDIDQYVLRKACLQNKAWQDMGYPPVPIAVNMSAQQFQRHDVVEKVAAILQETGLAGKWLEIEITESTAMRDIDKTIQMIQQLRLLDIKVALDDFGTGYSSLYYLNKLPVDSVKIDPTFMKDVVNDGNKEVLVHGIIDLVKKLKFIVTAEGVETTEQLEFLRQLQCDKAQGFLFSKPLAVGAVEKFIKSGVITLEQHESILL